MSFLERNIDVSFQLADDALDGGAGGSFRYTGKRCEASINNVAGASLNSLQFRVYGLPDSVMNKISTLGIKITTTRKNIITISATNNFGGMSQAFQGTIADAWIDYRGAPEVSLNVTAYAGFYEQIKSIAVNSYSGTTSVSSVIESLARSIGFSFVNNGVTAQLESPYFAGSALTQIKDCARHAGISYDISNGIVQIWPSGKSRDDVAFRVTPVGYPIFSRIGPAIQTEFNQDIILGRRIEVSTSLPQVSGKSWYCQTVRHDISSQVQNGPWFTYSQLTGEGFYVVK